MVKAEAFQEHAFKRLVSEGLSFFRLCVFRLIPRRKVNAVYYLIKSIGFLILFLIPFPLTFLITCVMLGIHFATRKTPTINPHAKRVLINGGRKTKAIQLARSFYSAGHYVVLTEEYPFATNRYSRCVSSFHLCGDTSNHTEYIQSFVDIVKKEHIDVFVPVSHSSTECVDSLVKQALLPLHCETIQGDIEQQYMLGDKYAFIEHARALGLSVPKSYKITDPKQVLEFDFSKEKCQFILKSIQYNSITRLNLVKLPCKTHEEMVTYVNSLDINEQFPWIMQEFIPGTEYCTQSVIKNGELRLHVCCESSAWLLNYKHIDKQNILKWVEEFSLRANLTGQVSFDFIESSETGLVYPLECNPRTHTAITAFYNHPLVAEAYLGTEKLLNGPIQPKANARPTYWLYHELWNILKVRSIKDLIKQWKVFVDGKEAFYSVEDPWPFFLHYTVHLPALIIYYIYHMIPFNKVDCNLSFCF